MWSLQKNKPNRRIRYSSKLHSGQGGVERRRHPRAAGRDVVVLPLTFRRRKLNEIAKENGTFCYQSSVPLINVIAYVTEPHLRMAHAIVS